MTASDDNDDDGSDLLSNKIEGYRNINWNYWRSMGLFTLEEAAALTLSIDPKNLHSLKADLSSAAKEILNQYLTRIDQIRRAYVSRTIMANKVDNKIFFECAELVLWAEKYSIDLPDEFKLKFSENQFSYESLCEKIRLQEDEIEILRATLNNNNPTSMLVFYKMFYAMAKDKFGYPARTKSIHISAIQNACQKHLHEIPDDETIDKHLERAYGVIKAKLKKAAKNADSVMKTLDEKSH